MKTHKGTKKRFKVTSTKKVLAQGSGTSHLLEKKSRPQKNRLKKFKIISHTKYKKVCKSLVI